MTRIFFAILKEVKRKDGVSTTLPAMLRSGEYLVYDEDQFKAGVVQTATALLVTSKTKRFGMPKFTIEECTDALTKAFDQKVAELQEQTIHLP